VQLLEQHYAPSLARDPTLVALLQRSLGVQLGVGDGGSGGPLAGLLGQLLSG
jgi:hypothetical protein